MQSPSFGPGSLFGVPSSPFPPGMEWHSLQEMLHQVMADFHRTWVQDHLIRPDPQIGSSVLCSETQLKKAFPISYTGHGDWNPNVSICGLLVPAYTKHDLTAGVTVEVDTGRIVPVKVLSKNHRFGHYILNNRTGSICTLFLDDEKGIIDLTFHTLYSLSSSRYLHLCFKAAPFLEALSPGAIDFAALQKCLMSSAVGYSARQIESCECMEPCCIACRGEGAMSPGVPVRKALEDNVEFGDYFAKTVISTYEDAHLVSAVPFFAGISRHFGIKKGTVNEMVLWGMAERLGRCRNRILPAPLFFPVEDLRAKAQVNQVLGLETDALGSSLSEIETMWFDNTYVRPVSVPDATENEGFREKDLDIRNVPCNEAVVIHDITIGPSITSDETAPLNLLSHVPLGPPPPSIPALPAKAEVPCSPSRKNATLRIAPGPVRIDDVPDRHQDLTREKARLRKEELRKIRKREAAFRSNKKRSERRRLARLAKERLNLTSAERNPISSEQQ